MLPRVLGHCLSSRAYQLPLAPPPEELPPLNPELEPLELEEDELEEELEDEPLEKEPKEEPDDEDEDDVE